MRRLWVASALSLLAGVLAMRDVLVLERSATSQRPCRWMPFSPPASGLAWTTARWWKCEAPGEQRALADLAWLAAVACSVRQLDCMSTPCLLGAHRLLPA